MNYTVKQVRKEDAKAMLEYLKQVGSETNYLLFDAQGVDMTLKQEEAFLASINSTPTSRMFVVKDQDKIIANAHIHGHIKERTKHKASIGISVLKAYWNKGIGSLLIHKLIDYAKSTSFIETIYLEVISENIAAINLYKKFDFEIYATDKRSTKVGNRYFDNYLMRLDFTK